MRELEREYVWFRPMMDTVAQRLLESVGWGLKMRLYTGASLSTMDLFSDLYMIYTYATTGQQGVALSLAIMVGLCLGGQCLLVWLQTRKGPKLVMLKELLIVLSGMKPGIDAMRVAGGNEQAKNAAISPDMELATTRCIEMVSESVPGTLLQVHSLLIVKSDGGNFGKAALASIIVSALTTGFGAAITSFDFDVNPQRRRDEPDFYGYIPDAASSRTLIFFFMIINSALLLLVRSVSFALLVMAGGRWVLVYLVSDMGLYVTYKILRRDFWHWIPLEGAASVVESVLERLLVKVLVDFTGVIQFRAAGEMGGAWFTFSTVVTLAVSFISTHFYYASLEENEEGVMMEGDAWMMVGGLSAGWICFFTAFLLIMKSGFRGTFFSLQTGHAWVKSFFVDYEEDRIKMFVHGQNQKQWASIRDDVKEYTLDNWERWEEEKPPWFNGAFKASVDEDMIPAGSREGGRRRSSLGDILFGGSEAAQVVPVGGGI
ncbi:hypothetical protein TeGR_g4188 [Tetraparma gracilis]|nr:hypothetical protein TeGR_g4188 [Tetraparma gracilis]